MTISTLFFFLISLNLTTYDDQIGTSTSTSELAQLCSWTRHWTTNLTKLSTIQHSKCQKRQSTIQLCTILHTSLHTNVRKSVILLTVQFNVTYLQLNQQLPLYNFFCHLLHALNKTFFHHFRNNNLPILHQPTRALRRCCPQFHQHQDQATQMIQIRQITTRALFYWTGNTIDPR